MRDTRRRYRVDVDPRLFDILLRFARDNYLDQKEAAHVLLIKALKDEGYITVSGPPVEARDLGE